MRTETKRMADRGWRTAWLALFALCSSVTYANGGATPSDYKVGPGDLVKITVYGAPDMSTEVRVAESGGITLSYETYALVRDMVPARPQAPITMKGISREVIPYAVEAAWYTDGSPPPVINARVAGLDVFLDLEAMDEKSRERAKGVLEAALAAIKAARGRGPAPEPAG